MPLSLCSSSRTIRLVAIPSLARLLQATAPEHPHWVTHPRLHLQFHTSVFAYLALVKQNFPGGLLQQQVCASTQL